MTEYSFVLDINDKKLAPCNINKAWYLIRKNKAILVQKIPMVIKLKKEVKFSSKLNNNLLARGNVFINLGRFVFSKL